MTNSSNFVGKTAIRSCGHLTDSLIVFRTLETIIVSCDLPEVLADRSRGRRAFSSLRRLKS